MQLKMFGAEVRQKKSKRSSAFELTARERDPVPSVLVCELELRDLVLGIHLGCTEDERRRPQDVSFSIFFRFLKQPSACQTDRLEDTICYARVRDLLEQETRDREFQLIEYLGQEIFRRLKGAFGDEALICLQVHKLKPPVLNLRGGSLFRIGDA